MAREPMTVEVVSQQSAIDLYDDIVARHMTTDRLSERVHLRATLAPGSRSELVQRLGEAQLELAEAEAAGDAVVTEEHYDAWLARMGKAINNQLTALAALRQHDTEHGRTTE